MSTWLPLKVGHHLYSPSRSCLDHTVNIAASHQWMSALHINSSKVCAWYPSTKVGYVQTIPVTSVRSLIGWRFLEQYLLTTVMFMLFTSASAFMPPLTHLMLWIIINGWRWA
jgi:hypothetical protein